MGINDSGRKKLTIAKLLEKRKVGEAEVQEFTAHIEGEEANAKYGVWSKALYEHIKPETTIDCDVVIKTSEKLDPDGNPYQNRKVTQIYVDGKPVSEKKSYGGNFQRQDNTESIEKQVAIKEIGECWRSGKFKDDDKLVIAYKAWLLGRMSPPAPTTTPVRQPPVASQAQPATDSHSKGLPASQREVFDRLVQLVKDGMWTEERALKEVSDRGGNGANSFQMIKSLKPDKLQELNQALDNATQEAAKELFE